MAEDAPALDHRHAETARAPTSAGAAGRAEAGAQAQRPEAVRRPAAARDSATPSTAGAIPMQRRSTPTGPGRGPRPAAARRTAVGAAARRSSSRRTGCRRRAASRAPREARNARADAREPAGDGRYVVDGNDLSVGGRWQVEVAVRRLDREDSVAAYRFDLGVIANDGGAAIPLPAFTSAYTPLSLALLILGLGIGLWCIKLSGLPRNLRQGYATAPTGAGCARKCPGSTARRRNSPAITCA